MVARPGNQYLHKIADLMGSKSGSDSNLPGFADSLWILHREGAFREAGETEVPRRSWIAASSD
jgi:hypothetical protein